MTKGVKSHINTNKKKLSIEKDNKFNIEKVKKIKILLDIANLFGFVYMFYHYNKLKGYNSMIASFTICIVTIYFTGRILQNRKILAIFHVLWAILMIIIPLIAVDKYLLLFHISLIIFTLATRKIFDGCIVRNLEKKNEEFTNNSLTKRLDWDIIFPILGFITNIKLFI
jgi:hypothetical protein